jgi:ABC-type antimicrobial peptide transport system permease subunit
MRCVTECASAVPQVRSMIEAAGGTVMEIEPMGTTVGLQLAPTRIRSVVAGVYAAFGLLLAVAGIYGLVRHVALARTHEVAIRMALGATPAQARRIIVRYGATTVVTGVAIGAGLAWRLLSLSQSLLYGVTAADATSYLAAASALLAGGLLASIGPARRLGRLDPRRLLGE